VPLDALFFLSIYDDWGRQKLHYFTSLGLATHVLREVSPGEKGLSASEIRRRMASNEPWEELVPPAVTRLLKQWDIPRRLQTAEQTS
jgi:nicotinamide mononucleotide adenylyltransferase